MSFALPLTLADAGCTRHGAAFGIPACSPDFTPGHQRPASSVQRPASSFQRPAILFAPAKSSPFSEVFLPPHRVRRFFVPNSYRLFRSSASRGGLLSLHFVHCLFLS